MFPSFLPISVHQLQEPEAIALAQRYQQIDVTIPQQQDPIPTAYVQQGNGGTPILLVHGFDSSSLEYRYLIPHLAAFQTIYTVDLLGFGFTARNPNFTYNPETIKAHLYRFWQTQIKEPVIIIGASMGGAVALDFALTYPAAIAQIVLIDSAGLANQPFSRFLMFPPIDRWATNFLGSMNIRRKIYQAAYFDNTRITADAVLCGAMHLNCPYWAEALISFTKGGGYGNFAPLLPQIQQQTLILWGEQDKILGTKDATKFQRLLPHGELHWISQAGHLPHVEQAEAIAAKIRQFSQKNLAPIP